MHFAEGSRAGLPVVPREAEDELLGSWLMRVAQVYGLQLHVFLFRLGALAATGSALPPWYELHHSHLRCSRLAAALHRPVELFAAMSVPPCKNRLPSELGFCGRCLDEASSKGAPERWLRRWMHPMALACEKHRSWLDPIATSHLRTILTIGDITRRPREYLDRPAPSRQRASASIDCALWLEPLVVNPVKHVPPWGKTEPQQTAKILRCLTEILMMPTAAQQMRLQLARSLGDLPAFQQRWGRHSFRMDDGMDGDRTLSAPHHLRLRQFVVALIGHYLRLSPSQRTHLKPMTKLIANELSAWQLAQWPSAAATWVSPSSATNVPSRRRRPKPPRPPTFRKSALAPL